MYSKLNISDIIKGHKLSLNWNKDNCKYKVEYIILPILFSLLFTFIKVPDNDVKNIFGICFSILIGLCLNILVLLISSISSEKLNISNKQKSIRLALLKETLYNVSFSVFVSVKALIVLFLSTILIFNIQTVDDLTYIFFNCDLNYLIQFLLGFLLYKYSIDVFLILFMILKRINILYTKEIFIEDLKITKASKFEIEEDD